jgi:glutamyl/glutaminyl-tRNA synthetase
LRDQGYLSIAIINYLARLGHATEAQMLLSFDQLAAHFNIEKISRSPARFDLNQLLFWQKQAIQAMDHVVMWQWLGDKVLSQVPHESRDLFINTVRGNIHFPDDARQLAKIFFHETVNYNQDDAAILVEAGEQYFVEAELAFDRHGLDWKAIANDMKTSLGVAGKKLFMPMRIALTGQQHGPELQPILQLLGIQKIKHRLGSAFKRVA